MKGLKIGTRIDEGHEGESVTLDVEKLIYSRALIQANSGGGKSGLLRVIAEQVAAHVPTIIIDKEGEYHTLREKLDIVLVGEQGELSADVRSAALLARKLVELGASAVIDLFDLKDAQRHEFVKQFFNALVNLPRKLWHPMFVLIDEAHLFCPEKGQGDSIAKSAALDLMTLGRKRGICGIPATQRLSKFDKNAAEVNNVFIGRTWLDVDQARAGKALGLSSKDALMLRDFEPREFCAFGPALNATGVIRFRVSDAQTTIPKPGDRASLTPPKASHVVSEIATKLKDLPQQAEAEIKDLNDAKARVSSLERELRAVKRNAPVVEKPIETIKEIEKPILKDTQIKRLESTATKLSGTGDKLSEVGLQLVTVAKEITASLAKFSGNGNGHRPRAVSPVAPRPVRVSRPAPVKDVAHTDDDSLSGPEQRILDAIAWLESLGIEAPEQTAVAFLAGYTFGGGGFNNPKGRLNSRGFVSYVSGNRISLTDEGRGRANYPTEVLTAEELQRRVLERLPGPERKILQVCLDAYPEKLTNEQCAERAGYTAGGGGFNNPKGRLRSLGLVDYPERNHVVALPLLFLE